MQRIIGLALAAGLASALLAACAGGEDDSGSGGSAGAAGQSDAGDAEVGPDSGGSAGSAGSAGGGGTAGGGEDATADVEADVQDAAGEPPTNCGNGTLDPGEACEGTDFGGKTCASIGLGKGDLLCNGYCSIVASKCVPLETCGDGKDNDKDGATDCDDDECTSAAACLDSCASPKVATVPGSYSGDTLGKPSTHAGSCTNAKGSELVYELVATNTGVLRVSVYAGNQMAVYIRTECSNAASELACGVTPSSFETLELGVDVTQGQKVYVFVDETMDGSSNWFNLTFDIPAPESGFECTNFKDDDVDDYVDCDDATACQSSPECTPGAGAPGSACSLNTQCKANQNDPVCLPDPKWPGGYCSEFCDKATSPCAAGSLCYDLGISVHGVCLDTCSVNGDCRPGYDCVDKGLGQKVCFFPNEWKCGDFIDNDEDKLIDCEDADKCQTLPACLPGPGLTGSTCSLSNECQANKKDPICLLTPNGQKFPDGYCSEFCDQTLKDCPGGSHCSSFLGLASGNGVCMKGCTTSADCRPGYNCVFSNAGVLVCAPPGVVP